MILVDTIPIPVRRVDDPPSTDYVSKRHSLESLWRDKFDELTEREHQLRSNVAQISAQLDVGQLEVNDKMVEIMVLLAPLADISLSVQTLHQQVKDEHQEHERLKHHDMMADSAIMQLRQQISILEKANHYLRHERILFRVNVIVLMILTAVVFYHVLFSH